MKDFSSADHEIRIVGMDTDGVVVAHLALGGEMTPADLTPALAAVAGAKDAQDFLAPRGDQGVEDLGMLARDRQADSSAYFAARKPLREVRPVLSVVVAPPDPIHRAARRNGGIEPVRLMGMEHYRIAIVASRAPKRIGLKPLRPFIQIERRGHALGVRYGPQGDALVPRKRNGPDSSRKSGPAAHGERAAIRADKGRRPGTARVVPLIYAAAGAT